MLWDSSSVAAQKSPRDLPGGIFQSSLFLRVTPINSLAYHTGPGRGLLFNMLAPSLSVVNRCFFTSPQGENDVAHMCNKTQWQCKCTSNKKNQTLSQHKTTKPQK